MKQKPLIDIEMRNPNPYDIQDMTQTPCCLEWKGLPLSGSCLWKHLWVRVSGRLTSSAQSVIAGSQRRGQQSSETGAQVSSAPGSAVRVGALGGRVVAQAPGAAAGAAWDRRHLLSAAPLFAPDGREDAPRSPWRVWLRALAQSARAPSGFQSYWGSECVLFAPAGLKELNSVVAPAAVQAGWG